MMTEEDTVALSLIVLLAVCSVPALLAGLYTGDRLFSLVSQITLTTVVCIVLVVRRFTTMYKSAKALFYF